MNPIDNLRSPEIQRNLQFAMGPGGPAGTNEESNLSTHKNSYNLSLDDR